MAVWWGGNSVSLTLRFCLVKENQAISKTGARTVDGAGIAAFGPLLTIMGSEVTGNEAIAKAGISIEGGGVASLGGRDTIIVNSRVVDNVAKSFDGGSISGVGAYVLGDLTVRASEFSGNRAASGAENSGSRMAGGGLLLAPGFGDSVIGLFRGQYTYLTSAKVRSWILPNSLIVEALPYW